MRAFEVSINRKRLCLAGIGDDGVLSAIVNWVTREASGNLFLEVGGLISPADEHVAWVSHKRLRVGDRVEVRIVEARSVDKPKMRRRMDPAQRVRDQKRYVRRMAKQLGWRIEARSTKSV